MQNITFTDAIAPQMLLKYIDWFDFSNAEYEDMPIDLKQHCLAIEDFIRSNVDYVHWEGISYNVQLSEAFIREFADRVDWKGISLNQRISDTFAEEFKDRIDQDQFKRNGMSHTREQ